jgi:hypothetical protein
MHVGSPERDWGSMVFQALLYRAVSSVQAGRADDGWSSAGAGGHTDTTTDLDEENLPPVPRCVIQHRGYRE